MLISINNLAILRVLYNGELTTSRPAAIQSDPQRIELNEDVKIERNYYHGMTYKSAVPLVRTAWDYEIRHPGKYEVFVTCKVSKGKQAGPLPAVLTLEGEQFHFTPSPSAKPVKVSLGKIELKESGRHRVTLTADAETLPRQEGNLDPQVLSIQRLKVVKIEMIRSK